MSTWQSVGTLPTWLERLTDYWRSAMTRLGGPDAVTWPAFWLSYAANLLGNLTWGGTIPIPLSVRLVLVSVSQLVMFAPLVLLRATLLRDAQRPHPIVGIVALIGAPILRGAALAGMLALISPADAQTAFRIVSGTSNLAIILIITALAVGGVRSHRRRMAHLLSMRAELERSLAAAEFMVQERNQEVVAELKELLSKQLGAIEPSGAEQAADSLERLASDVVRPLSHELAGSIPTWTPEPAREERVGWRRVIDATLAGRPFRPIVSAALLGVMVIYATLSLFGPPIALGILIAECVLIPFCLWAANMAFERSAPHLSRTLRALLLLILSLIAASAMALAITLILGNSSNARPLTWTCFVFVPLVSLTLAAEKSSRIQREQVEADIRQSTATLRRSIVRLHQAQWYQQKALSRALHGPVQSAVTAAVLRLRASDQPVGSSVDVIARVQEGLRSSIDVLGRPPTATSLDDSLDHLRSLWGSLCEVSIDIDEDARHVMTNDPVGLACVVELMNEALSNAIRHGDTRLPTVALRSEDGNVHLVVVDDGCNQTPAGPAGMGTRLFDECTLEWDRTPLHPGQRVTALIPVGDTA